MQSIPVDTARLGVLRCAIAPEVKFSNVETQEVKKDRDGNPVYTVAVTVRQTGGGSPSSRSPSAVSRPGSRKDRSSRSPG